MSNKKVKENQWRGWYRELVVAWWQHRDSTMAAAIAYRALFSLVPLLMAVLVMVNLIEDSRWIFNQVAVAGEGFGIDFIKESLATVTVNQDWLHLPPTFLWVMVLVMIYGASTAFRELTLALTIIFNTRSDRWWRGNIWLKVGAFLMVLVLGALLLLFTLFGWAMAAVEDVVSLWLPALARLMDYMDWILAPLLLLGFLLIIYRVLPLKKTPFKVLFPGAFVATLLLWGGQSLMTAMIKNTSVTTIFGTAGWIVSFLLWVYYSSMIVLLGAEITQLTQRNRG